MKHINSIILLIGSLVTPAMADPVPNGLWQGTMVPPEGREVGVSFKVQKIAGRTTMTMSVPGMGVVPLQDPELEDGLITFGFKMGEKFVSCRLEATGEDAYSGPCEGEAGDGGSISMKPVE